MLLYRDSHRLLMHPGASVDPHCPVIYFKWFSNFAQKCAKGLNQSRVYIIAFGKTPPSFPLSSCSLSGK